MVNYVKNGACAPRHLVANEWWYISVTTYMWCTINFFLSPPNLSHFHCNPSHSPLPPTPSYLHCLRPKCHPMATDYHRSALDIRGWIKTIPFAFFLWLSLSLSLDVGCFLVITNLKQFLFWSGFILLQSIIILTLEWQTVDLIILFSNGHMIYKENIRHHLTKATHVP